MHYLESLILSLAYTLPLETFVVIGSFLEEIIAPIPSPSIMLIAGSFGGVQGYTYGSLAILVLLASIGKTFGGLVMYAIATTIKEVALPFLGKYLGVKKDALDRYSSRFTGTLRDYGIYIFLRSVPVIPSILLSFGSGVIRLPLRLFIIGTFVGTVVRDSFYIFVGYKGTEMLQQYVRSTSQAESLIQYLIALSLGVGILYLLYRQHKR